MKKILLLVMLLVLISCTPVSAPKFYEGEKVRVIITGEVGMVIYTHTFDGNFYYYDIRSVTNNVTKWMKEFELEKV
jgi:hypothetical protein